ncbi:MAG: hypothetical protein M1272_01990 [Firmicutes bacterium]|nr:hypothetical protein [Bacillota bacterium]
MTRHDSFGWDVMAQQLVERLSLLKKEMETWNQALESTNTDAAWYFRRASLFVETANDELGQALRVLAAQHASESGHEAAFDPHSRL